MLQQIVRIDTDALRRILEVSMDTGKATAGGAASLTDTTKEWVVNEFVNYAVEITEGTGKGQFRQITANTATVLTVAAWTTVPDATSWYRITPFGIIAGIVFADIQKWGTVVQTGYNITPLFRSIPVDEGTVTVLAVGATLTDSAKNWTANIFKGYNVRIVQGTGIGQTRKIPSNTANQLTVDSAWGVQPTTDSIYSIYLAPVTDPVGDMGVFIASGDMPIGRVTIQSMAYIASGDQPIGRINRLGGVRAPFDPVNYATVTSTGDNDGFNDGWALNVKAGLLSNDQPIGRVTIQSMANIASGDESIGKVTIQSMCNIASGDEPIGRVTIQSMANLASGNEPIGQVTIASFGGGLSSSDVPIGQVTVRSMVNIASGNEPIGGVRVIGSDNASFATVSSTGDASAFRDGYLMGVRSYPLSSNLKMGNVTILSGDDPIGKVTVQSMANIASGDEPMGRVTIQSSPYIASGDEPIGRVTIASFGGGLSSSDVSLGRVTVQSMANIASGDEPMGRVTIQSSPYIASGDEPIGRVTIASFGGGLSSSDVSLGRVTVQSMVNIASGDEPMGRVTVQSFMGGLASGDEPMGRVTIQSSPYIASGDEPLGRVTIQSMANIASGDESIGKVTIQSMCSLASGDRPIGQVTIASMPLTTISPTWDARTMNFAVIATTTSGDNNIVPLVQSSRIIVRSVIVVASGAVNMKWVSGSSAISGLMPLTVNGGYSAHDPEGLFQTGIGEDLIINADNTVPIGGHLGYITRLS